jgi:peptidoglycan/xylan/chitin deacetylase (PgdA/CDA1 family)
MELLRRQYRTISLRDLAEGQMPPRSIVVTLDDGYHDNLTEALPLLERFEIPATVFVTSGSIGDDREFWWDEIVRLLVTCEPAPDELILEIKGRTFRWPTSTSGERHTVAKSLVAELKSASRNDLDTAIAALRTWCGGRKVSAVGRRPLRRAELLELAAHSLIEIGSHTRSHIFMASHSEASQRQEVVDGRSDLEQWIGRSMTSFAYPFGLAAAISAESRRAVELGGIRIACTLDGKVATRSSDLLQLSRIFVGDWDEATFSKRIEAHANGWI